jgi:spermidine synthase
VSAPATGRGAPGTSVRPTGRHRRETADAPPGPDTAVRPASSGPEPEAEPATDLPLPPSVARWVVLAAVLVCSACGLVYELALVALGGQLQADPVAETSVVLSVMVFAMGLGALAAKPFHARSAEAFALVEAALAVVGGTSVPVVHAAAQGPGLYRPAMIAVCLATGMLVGAEIPLLMTLVQRIRRQDAGHAVADLFAADYVGALAGGLLFPFLLLPALGQAGTTAVVGGTNALVGTGVVLWLFRADLGTRARARVCALVGAALLVLAAVAAYGPAPAAATRKADAAKCSYSCSTGA